MLRRLPYGTNAAVDSKEKIMADFVSIISAVENIAATKTDRTTILKRVCELLHKEVSYFDWVGFYLIDPENPKTLLLGPFVGAPTEHLKINVGEGICGQAAQEKNTFVVQDVSKETNYLSCSSQVKSEIVVPIYANGEIVGELDIDSHELSPFTPEDRTNLERICELLSALF